MNVIITSVIIFCEIVQYMILIDVIMSWLAILGLRLRLGFIRDVLDPLYKRIQTLIPTKVGAFDFTPIIALLLLGFINGILMMNFPEVRESIRAFL